MPIVLQQCLELLRPGGRLLILGYQPGQTFPLEPFTLVSKWIQIIASHNHTVKDVEDVASLVSDGRVKPIISDRYAMEEANGALDKLRQGTPLGGSFWSGKQRIYFGGPFRPYVFRLPDPACFSMRA